MLTIQTNKINIAGRIFFLLIIFAIQYFIIENGIIVGNAKHEIGLGILYGILTILSYVLILIIRSFFQVLKVQMENSLGEIILSGFFYTNKLCKDDIAGYYTTIYKGSRATLWNGLIIKTVQNKSFRLTEQNLKSIHVLKEFLEKENIKYLGERRPFFSQ